MTIKKEAGSNRLITAWIIIYALATYSFLAPVVVNLNVLKVVSWSCIFIGFYLSFGNIFFIHSAYSRYSGILRLMVIMIILSMFSSLYLHDQGLSFGIRIILTVLPYSFFFFLQRYTISQEQLEKIIWIVMGIHLLAYFIAIFAAPLILFDLSGAQTEINDSRGIARVSVLGGCFVHLCFFMSINRWLVTKKNLFIYLSLAIFLIIVLKVSRQHIIFALVVGLFMVLSNTKWYLRFSITLLTFAIVSFAINNIEIIQNLIKLSQNQVEEDGLDNIRVLALKYYFFDYNTSLYQVVMGNGIPHLGSSWGKSFQFFTSTTGFIPSDVGYAKLYFYWGLTGLILFLYLSYKILTQRVPPSLAYCKYYVWFVILTNIGSHSFFTEIMTLTFVVYILDINYKNVLLKKREEKRKRIMENLHDV